MVEFRAGLDWLRSGSPSPRLIITAPSPSPSSSYPTIAPGSEATDPGPFFRSRPYVDAGSSQPMHSSMPEPPEGRGR